MAGFTLFRASSACPPEVFSRTTHQMQSAFVKHRDIHGSLVAHTLVAPTLCQVTKFDGPHSSVAGIFRHSDQGSWITGVGSFSYAGQSVAGRPSLMEQLLADALSTGMDVYQRLNGLFVVAYYNAHTGAVWVLPSVTGAQPVFVCQSNEGVGVATSVLSLATLGNRSIDPMAVYSMLRSRRFPAPHTFFQEISSLPFGHALEIQSNSVVRHRVWAPQLQRCPYETAREAAEGIATHLADACRELIDGRREVVADLTGGYDSRTACAALVRAGIRFCCTVTGFEDSADVVCARSIAQGEGFDLRVQSPPVSGNDELIPHLENAVRLGEGHQDALTLGGILYGKARLHARNLGVTVYGLYGELYRDRPHRHGYRVDLERPGPVKLDRLIRYSAYYDTAPWPRDLFRCNWREAWREALLKEMREVAAPYQDVSQGAQLDALFLNTQATHAGAPNHVTLSQYPHVAPLGSPQALGVALCVPPRWRQASALQMEIVRRLAPNLARYPMADGRPFEPMSLSNCCRFLPAYRAKYTRFLEKAYCGSALKLPFGGPAPQPLDSNILAPLIARERSRGGALHYQSMVSGIMYNPVAFDKLFGGYEQASFRENNLVSSIYTLEVLARLAGLHDFKLAW